MRIVDNSNVHPSYQNGLDIAVLSVFDMKHSQVKLGKIHLFTNY